MHISVKKIAQLTGHQGSVFALTQGHTPQYILSGAGDGWLVEWDLSKPDTGKLLAKVETNIFSLLFLPNLNKIIAGNRDGGLHFVDLTDSDKTKNIAHHKKGVFSIQWLDNQLFTLGGDGVLTRWSIEQSRAIESLHLSAKSLRCLDYNAQKEEIAIGASDGHIYFINKNLELTHILKNAHQNSVFTLKYSPDGQYLISGGRDAHLKVWFLSENLPQNDVHTEGGANPNKNTYEHEIISNSSLNPHYPLSIIHYPFLNTDLPAHWFTINVIAFHPKDPSIFATASRDKTIKIWSFKPNNTEKLTLLKVLDTVHYGGHINSVNALYWSSYNNYLISGSDDRSLIIWQLSL